VPGAPAVIVNSWSVSSAFDFLNCFSTLTTVCGSSSRLIHVIFSPDFTVKVWGLKAKSLISILFCLLPVESASFISPASVKIDRLRKLMAHNSAIFLFLRVSVFIVSLGLVGQGQLRLESTTARALLPCLYW